MISKEGSTKILNFMNPREGLSVLGCGHIGDILKMLNFFKDILIYSRAK